MFLYQLPFLHQHIDVVLEILSDMNLNQLKAVITSARSQLYDCPEDSTLYAKSVSVIRSYLRNRKTKFSLPTPIIENAFRFMVQSELLSGLLINLALAVEPSISEIEQSYLDSMASEIACNEWERRPSQINWSAVFDASRTDQPLVLDLPPRPTVNARIYNIFDSLRYDYRNKTLYAYGSKKGVSGRTQEELRDLEVWMGAKPKDHYSAEEAIRVSFTYRTSLCGPSEMKQRWYPTGLKPRTYYAQGGTALQYSMYLRQIFNEIADRFPYTNRHTRVDGTRLISRTLDGEDYLVYDYSSFTSNFSEQYYFLGALASFMEGTTVFLAGPDLTFIACDLGELILGYRDVCNDLPEYYTICDTMPSLINLPLFHHQAGFLGVYGNLMTCTIPHGILARNLVDSDDQVGTAGDDGAIEPSEDLPLSLPVKTLLRLGDFAVDKVYKKPFVYLKRPLEFRGGCGYQKRMIVFPNLSRLGAVKDGRVSRRFRMPQDKDPYSIRHAAYTSIVALVRSTSRLPVTSTDEESMAASRLLNHLIKDLELGPTPHSATIKLTVEEQDRHLPALYDIPLNFFSHQLSDRFYPNWTNDAIVCIPKRAEMPFSMQIDLESGNELTANFSVKVKYLVQCGYLVQQSFDRDLDTEPVFLRDIGDYLKTGPVVHRFVVGKEIRAEVLYGLFSGKYDEHLHTRALSLFEFEVFQSERKRREHGYIPYGAGRYYHDLDMPLLSSVDELFYDDPLEEESGMREDD